MTDRRTARRTDGRLYRQDIRYRYRIKRPKKVKSDFRSLLSFTVDTVVMGTILSITDKYKIYKLGKHNRKKCKQTDSETYIKGLQTDRETDIRFASGLNIHNSQIR